MAGTNGRERMKQASGGTSRGFQTSWSIRRKLVLLLMVVFLPASGIIVASGIDQRNHEIEEAEENALLLVHVLAVQQEQVAAGIQQMLGALAMLPEVRRLDAEACNRIFQDLRRRYPSYSMVAAVTAEGTILAASPPLPAGHTGLSGEKCFVDALGTLDFSAGEYVPGNDEGMRTIHYAQPVTDAAGSPVGVVIAGFDLNECIRVLQRVGFSDNIGITIADHRGVVLYHVPEQQVAVPGKMLPKETFMRISGAPEGGTFEANNDEGTTHLYAFKPLRLRANTPPYLYMIADMTRTKVLEYANRKVATITLSIGLVAFIAGCLAWMFGNAVFVKPIGLLARTARRFGKGEFDARTDLPHTPDELGELARSFDEMASLLEMRSLERSKAAEALRESEEKYRALIETTNTGYVILDDRGRVLDANAEYVKLTVHGSLQEIMGRNVTEWTAPYHLDLSAEAMKQCLDEGFLKNLVIDHSNREGGVIPIEINASLIRSAGGTSILVLCRDIAERWRAEEELLQHREHLEELVRERTAKLESLNTQLEEEINVRKRAEERIQASLEEKEILLREIHHRVKNNLQTIASLINLQSKYTTDARFLELSRESHDRIRSMLLVHEKLYRSTDLSRVDFFEYLQTLADSLFRSYCPSGVILKVEGEKVFLGVDTAIPCALLVNELLSNALHHAFPGGRRGTISIVLHSSSDGKLILTIGDNGIGLPGGLDYRNSDTLGLQLVATLVHQLKAEVELDTDAGAKFTITFAELRYRGGGI